MKRIARFGKVWKHRKTGQIHDASIEVKSFDELQEYVQVPKFKAKEVQAKKVQAKEEESPKEAGEDALFTPAKSRRSQ